MKALAAPSRTKLTPPELARQWGVEPAKIIGFIRGGELRAINIASNPRGRRPRFLIDIADIAEFETRRAVHTSPPSPPPRRKRPAPNVIEYY